MKRVFFLNRYFFPDHCATSQLLSDLAFDLAAAGTTDIHVITGQQLYDEPEARLPAQEFIRGVHIHRIPTTRFGRAKLIGRAIDYLSFYVSARRALLRLVRRGDLVVAMTDPPLISIIAMHVAHRRQARFINWLQDIYPEVARELGIAFLRGPIARFIFRLRDRCLKSAACNIVVGERMGAIVASRGAPPERIHLIPNWTDDEEIHPIPHAANALRREWHLEHKFVLGYSGNLGRAHEYETVLGAAEIVKSRPDIVFLFVGGGHQFDTLARLVKERGLSNFRFMPYQDRAALKYSLAVADVHWVSLRPGLEGLIVPSKIYGVAAAGRPVISIGAKDGEIAGMVERHQCGINIELGDSSGLAGALLNLSKNADACATMGSRARAMLESHFTRRQAVQQWRDVLEKVSCSDER
jgi:glycosyltransferase involved in cell wall biosynthesis